MNLLALSRSSLTDFKSNVPHSYTLPVTQFLIFRGYALCPASGLDSVLYMNLSSSISLNSLSDTPVMCVNQPSSGTYFGSC